MSSEKKKEKEKEKEPGMDLPYICSEWAVMTILKDKGIEKTIPELKKCESLEQMMPCLPKEAGCMLGKITFEKLIDLVNQTGNVAVRILNPDLNSGYCKWYYLLSR